MNSRLLLLGAIGLLINDSNSNVNAIHVRETQENANAGIFSKMIELESEGQTVS